MKPKPLPSSLRDKKRYVVFQIISSASPRAEEVADTIFQAGLSLFGEVGLSKMNLKFMANLYDEEAKAGIVRCRPGYVEEVRLILSSIMNVADSPCIFHVLGVTGTIRTAKIKYLKHLKEQDR